MVEINDMNTMTIKILTLHSLQLETGSPLHNMYRTFYLYSNQVAKFSRQTQLPHIYTMSTSDNPPPPCPPIRTHPPTPPRDSLVLLVIDAKPQVGEDFEESCQTLAGCPLHLWVVLVHDKHAVHNLQPLLGRGLHSAKAGIGQVKYAVHYAQDIGLHPCARLVFVSHHQKAVQQLQLSHLLSKEC